MSGAVKTSTRSSMKTDWSNNDQRLREAAQEDNVGKVRNLVHQKKTNPWKISPSDGTSTVHFAAGNSSTEVLDILLVYTGRDIDSKDNFGKTALQYASLHGKPQNVKRLLQGRANPQVRDVDGQTALHHACYGGNMDCVRQLLANDRQAVNVKDNSGQTALLHAAAKNRATLCRLLFEAGADVNAGDATNRSPLMIASSQGHQAVCDYLLSVGADMSATDSSGWTAALYANHNNCTGILKLMLRKFGGGQGNLPFSEIDIERLLEKRSQFQKIQTSNSPVESQATQLEPTSDVGASDSRSVHRTETHDVSGTESSSSSSSGIAAVNSSSNNNNNADDSYGQPSDDCYMNLSRSSVLNVRQLSSVPYGFVQPQHYQQNGDVVADSDVLRQDTFDTQLLNAPNNVDTANDTWPSNRQREDEDLTTELNSLYNEFVRCRECYLENHSDTELTEPDNFISADKKFLLAQVEYLLSQLSLEYATLRQYVEEREAIVKDHMRLRDMILSEVELNESDDIEQRLTEIFSLVLSERHTLTAENSELKKSIAKYSKESNICQQLSRENDFLRSEIDRITNENEQLAQRQLKETKTERMDRSVGTSDDVIAITRPIQPHSSGTKLSDLIRKQLLILKESLLHQVEELSHKKLLIAEQRESLESVGRSIGRNNPNLSVEELLLCVDASGAGRRTALDVMNENSSVSANNNRNSLISHLSTGDTSQRNQQFQSNPTRSVDVEVPPGHLHSIDASVTVEPPDSVASVAAAMCESAAPMKLSTNDRPPEHSPHGKRKRGSVRHQRSYVSRHESFLTSGRRHEDKITGSPQVSRHHRRRYSVASKLSTLPPTTPTHIRRYSADPKLSDRLKDGAAHRASGSDGRPLVSEERMSQENFENDGHSQQQLPQQVSDSENYAFLSEDEDQSQRRIKFKGMPPLYAFPSDKFDIVNSGSNELVYRQTNSGTESDYDDSTTIDDSTFDDSYVVMMKRRHSGNRVRRWSTASADERLLAQNRPVPEFTFETGRKGHGVSKSHHAQAREYVVSRRTDALKDLRQDGGCYVLKKTMKDLQARVKNLEENLDKNDLKSTIPAFQAEIGRLQQQITEKEQHFQSVVATYRSHLLAAIQGNLESDVKDALLNMVLL